MITSKLTRKARTTVHQPVRAVLWLAKGDEIAYAIKSGRVTMTKNAKPEQAKSSFGIFVEWASEADCRAYDAL